MNATQKAPPFMNEYTTFYRCTRVYSLSILGWEEYISLFKFLKKIVQSYSTPREGLCNSFIVLNKTDNPDSLN